MSGPEFLALYAGLIAVTALASWWLIRGPGAVSGRGATPQLPADPDPYAIAHLRGGPNEVVRIAVLRLLERGYLARRAPAEVAAQAPPRLRQRADAESTLQQAPGLDPAVLPPIERRVHAAFAAPLRPSELFARSAAAAALRDALTADCREYATTQDQLGLLSSPRAASRAAMVRLVAVLLVVAVAVVRATVAVEEGHSNLGYLVVMAVVAAAVLAVWPRPRRLTRAGARYLARARLAYGGPAPVAGPAALAAAGAAALAVATPLTLLAALNGVGALAGGPLDYYPRLYRRAAAVDGGGCGGCGPGCGTGCASASAGGSGGDSGGSSCGGSSCGGGCGG